METYTASVVGGGVGGRLSMNGLVASDRFELIAVTDLRKEVLEELQKTYPGIQTFTSYKEMFTQCPTDVVCVSTWAPSHKEITLEALQLPLKGILVEKPLADTSGAGSELLNAIKEKRIPMAVPHGLLVADHSVEIIKRIHGGDIGQLELVEIECDKWDIINAGIHWLNFFVTLVNHDPVDRVLAACDTSTRTYRDGMQVETDAVTYVVTKSGVRCVMNTGDFTPIIREGKGVLFRLVGTKGMIEFWGWEGAYKILNAENPEGTLITVEAGPKRGHQRHLEAMVSRIDEGTIDYTIPESSLTALELCEAAYLSHKYRCVVPFPLDAFQTPESVEWDPGTPYSGSGGGRDGRKL